MKKKAISITCRYRFQFPITIHHSHYLVSDLKTMARTMQKSALPLLCRRCTQQIISPPRSFTRSISSTNIKSASSRPSSLTTSSSFSSPSRSQSSPFPFINVLEDNYKPPIHDPRLTALYDHRQPHRLHIFSTKHNTHLTFTGPAPKPVKFDEADLYKPPAPNRPLMSFACGNIGFKKAARGTYDAAFQLGAYVLKQIQERGLLREIEKVEIVLRGFGPGREALTKMLLGQEGRYIRSKIVAVTDSTKLKFGGSRSPRPKRLG